MLRSRKLGAAVIGLAAVATVLASLPGPRREPERFVPTDHLHYASEREDGADWHKTTLPSSIGPQDPASERTRWETDRLQGSLGAEPFDTSPEGVDNWPAIKHDDVSGTPADLPPDSQ